MFSRFKEEEERRKKNCSATAVVSLKERETGQRSKCRYNARGALRLTFLAEVSLGVAPQVISLVSFNPVSLVQCWVVKFRW